MEQPENLEFGLQYGDLSHTRTALMECHVYILASPISTARVGLSFGHGGHSHFHGMETSHCRPETGLPFSQSGDTILPFLRIRGKVLYHQTGSGGQFSAVSYSLWTRISASKSPLTFFKRAILKRSSTI